MKITTKPVIISHTGLDTQLGKNKMMAKMMLPRLISKEQATIVANAGGVIGVWTHLADTPLEYGQNIPALVDVIGVDHVCMGTDTKLTTPYCSPKDFGGKPGGPSPGLNPDNKPDSNKQNNKMPNPPANGKHIGERTNEAWADEKGGFDYTVVNAMVKTGFCEEEIGKIGGGNYCRVFDDATSFREYNTSWNIYTRARNYYYRARWMFPFFSGPRQSLLTDAGFFAPLLLIIFRSAWRKAWTTVPCRKVKLMIFAETILIPH